MNKFQVLRAVSILIVLSSLTSVSFASATYTVKSSDSLSQIINKFYKDSKLTSHQKYIGLLAENPNAFRLGNINYLKRGQALTIPDASDLLAMEQSDATSLVAEHNENANKRKKVKMPPPFENYSPRASSSVSNALNIKSLSDQQQSISKDLEKVNSESDALRARLDQLTADQKSMDAEIDQLDTLLKQ